MGTIIFALFMVAADVAAGALSDPVAVIRSRADEDHATAGWNRAKTVQYVAFSRKSLRTDRPNAYLRTIRRNGSSTTVKLNHSRQANVGGFYRGRRVLYAQANERGHDLAVYDIHTKRRWLVKRANTRRDEWLPTRSGRYLLFNRDDRGGPTTRVVLRNMKKVQDAETILARRTSWGAWVFAGQVAGSWAVWTVCVPRCDVFRRNLRTGVTTTLARPSETSQYDPSVTSKGTVYAARSSSERACDATIDLIRFGAFDPAEGTVVSQFPLGSYTTGMYARRNSDDVYDLFFARGSCETFRSDIFKLTVSAAATP